MKERQQTPAKEPPRPMISISRLPQPVNLVFNQFRRGVNHG